MSRKPAAPLSASPVVVSAQDCARGLRGQIVAAVPSIVRALIVKAEAGSYQHARFLFELAGLAAANAPESAAEESLEELLARLQTRGEVGASNGEIE